MSDNLKKLYVKKQLVKLFNILMIIVFLAIVGLTGWYIALTFKDKLDVVEEAFKKGWSTVQSLLILIMVPISILSGYIKIKSIVYHYQKENKKNRVIMDNYKKALNEPTSNEIIKKQQELLDMRKFEIKKKLIAKNPQNRKIYNLQICDALHKLHYKDLRGTKYIELQNVINNFDISNNERSRQIYKILVDVGIDQESIKSFFNQII